jgi:hypothetical protein
MLALSSGTAVSAVLPTVMLNGLSGERCALSNKIMTLNMYPSFILTLSLHVFISREAAFYDILTHSMFRLYFPIYVICRSQYYVKSRVSWDSSVSVVICYRLDSPGIESQWRQDFLHPSRRALWPTQTPIQWVPGASWGVASNTHSHLVPRLRKE